MINLFLEDEAIFLKLGRCDQCSNLLKFHVSVVLHAVHFPHIRNKNTLSVPVLKQVPWQRFYLPHSAQCHCPSENSPAKKHHHRNSINTTTIFFFFFFLIYSFLRPKYKCVLALSLWIVFWFLFCEVFLFRNLFCYFLLCRNTVIILPPQNSP